MKEVEHYKDEAVVNAMKVDEMKRDVSKDKYDIRRYEDILNESYMMIPDATKRLQLAIDDLSSCISNNRQRLDISGIWYQTAQTILRDHQNFAGDNQSRETSYATEQIIETRIEDLAEGEAF
jgi:tubulin-specific chaperone A